MDRVLVRFELLNVALELVYPLDLVDRDWAPLEDFMKSRTFLAVSNVSTMIVKALFLLTNSDAVRNFADIDEIRNQTEIPVDLGCLDFLESLEEGRSCF